MATSSLDLDNKTIGRYAPRTKPDNSQKGWADVYNYGALGGAYGSGGVGRNQDIAPTRYGAANAYRLVPPINRAVNLRADAIDSLPWSIIRNPTNDPKNDVTIARSTDNHPSHPFALAIQRMRRRQKKSFFWSLESDHLIYGEIFIELLKVSDDYGHERTTGVNWLNPLGVFVDTRMGFISGYRYSDLSSGEYTFLYPQDVAYNHTYHPMDDHRGLGMVSVVVDKVNVYRNTSRYVEAFFRNNALPGGVARPKDITSDHWTERERDIVKQEFRRNFQGTDNSFAFMVAPVPMDIDTFDQPDIEKQYSLNDPVRREIYEEFGIPLPMAGDTNGTSYQNQDAVLTWFYQNTIIPSAQNHQEYVNAEILPRFPDSDNCRLEFDTTAFDLVSSDDEVRSRVAGANYTSGLWKKNEARTYTKVDPVKDGDTFAEPKAQPQPGAPGVGVDVAPAENPDGVTQATQAANQLMDAKKPELPAPSIPGKATQVNADDELRAWRKVAVGNIEKAYRFESIHLSPLIKSMVVMDLEDLQHISGLIEPGKGLINGVFDRAAQTMKSESDYQRSSRALSRGLWSGQITSFDFLDGMNSAIRRAYTRAFYGAIENAGLSTDDLTANDKQKLEDLINTELTFVPELLTFIVQNSKSAGGKLTDIRERVDLWIARYDRIADVGKLVAGSITGKKYRWKRDPAKESCIDCLNLEGRVYYARTWDKYDIQPHSPRLKCFGTWCGCDFEETDEPVTQGKPPALHGKSITLDELDGIENWKAFNEPAA